MDAMKDTGMHDKDSIKLGSVDEEFDDNSSDDVVEEPSELEVIKKAKAKGDAKNLGLKMANKDNVVIVQRNNDEQDVVMEDEDFSDD